jgi:hypothetical protein
LIQTRLDFFLITDTLQDLVASTNIVQNVWSDHSAISITLNFTGNYKRGSGHWKFNVSLLEDEVYTNTVKEKIQAWIQQYSNVDDKQLKWELLKYHIRLFTSTYSKEKCRAEREKHLLLTKTLEQISIQLAENPNTESQNRYYEIQTELKQYEENKIKGMIIRSKAEWHEHGEKSTKYFYNLEKQNQTRKHVRKLMLDNGNTITDPDAILQESYTFYQNLYKKKQNTVTDSSDEFVDQNSLPRLSEAEKQDLDSEITVAELHETLLTFKCNTTPGNDGLPYDFYKYFWHSISQCLFECLTCSLTKGILPTSQRQATITLNEKKGKDRSQIKNWRPISLLNCDYKIFSKLLSNRLKKYLPYLIHENQTGYVKHRLISDSIRTVQDIMNYTLQNNLPGMMLLIDYEKAYDTLDWEYIWKTLQCANVGERFLYMVKLLYNNPESCIINNGRCSKYFTLERGVRQGDPLSAYLFTLTLETLAHKIRRDDNIKGIAVGTKEIKLTLYADDMTAIIRDKISATNLLSVMKLFQKCSGLKMNLEKTEGVWLGSKRFCQEKPFGIKWPDEPVRLLGLYISYDLEKATQLNYEDKIDKLKKQLHWWKSRSLTITGKVLIIKSLALSKFSLVASLVKTPDSYRKEVNSLLYEFLWNGKTDKIKRNLIKQDLDKGGIKMIDFDDVILSSQTLWIKRYLDNFPRDWKVTFESFCNVANLSLCLRNNYCVSEFPPNVPAYYKESLIAWKSIRCLSENTAELSTSVWYNENVKIGQRTVYSAILFKCGIWTFADLFDNDILIPFDTWIKRGVRFNEFLIWRGLVNIAKLPRLRQTLSHTKYNSGYASIMGKLVTIDDITSKEIKIFLRDQSRPTVCKPLKTFEEKYESVNNNWNNIFLLSHKCKVENYTKDVQYKIIHRILPTNKLLFQMNKIDSPICNFCNLYTQNLEHFLFECYEVKNFWFEVAHIWNYVAENTKFIPDILKVTFGVLSQPFKKWMILNCLILYGKHFLFTCKKENKHPNTRCFQYFIRRKCEPMKLSDTKQTLLAYSDLIV